MKIKEVIQYLESRFPLYWQESYDNCGIQCGDKEQKITGALICFNFSEEALDLAIQSNKNLVISHHPLIFKGIQKIEPTNLTGKLIIKAIENKIVLYSMHTNIDNGVGGGNQLFADKLGLTKTSVLVPKESLFKKIVFFAPENQEIPIMDALFSVGCGTIGNYKNCSFRTDGVGTFQPNQQAKPYIGKADITETVNEVRVEMIFPAAIQTKVIQTLYQYHPYEEPAFDIFNLDSQVSNIGLGMIGNLPSPMSGKDFFTYLKDKLSIQHFRYSGNSDKMIKKVAVCGGNGSGFIKQAFQAGADVYITGDITYHNFFLTENQMIIIDIGHYEGEYFIKEIIYKELIEKFSNFATIIFEGEKSGIILV